MRSIALSIISAMMGFGAVFAVGPSATAATCYTGGGGAQVLFVQSCGTKKSVTYENGGEKFGHVEIWEKAHPTTHWANSPGDELWGPLGRDRQTYTWLSVSWADATCAEFWWNQGGTYTRSGTIVCTPA